MQPADHRSPVYSLTAAAPHRTGSGGPNGWRVAARASNCNAATKFRRQGALSIGYCIWRSLHMQRIACKSLIFEGQEKSSRAVSCQDIAVAICRLSKPRKDRNPRSAPRNSFMLRTPSLRTQYVLRGRKRCRRRGRQRWLSRILADFSALPVKSSVGYSECRSGAHAVWPNAGASRGCEPR